MTIKKQIIFFGKTIDIIKITVYNSFGNQMK